MKEIIFNTPGNTTEHIYVGPNCIAESVEKLKSLGTMALIVTGRNSAEKNGSLADVKSVLEENGIPWSHVNFIEENPSVLTIMRAREIGCDENADFVIGIGGGSPMDAAKAIALMMANPDKPASFLYDKEAKANPAFPVVAVPTTCGTGSEVTGVSVLTRHELKTKQSMVHKVFPAYAFIDPSYLVTAPRQIINNTAMDAFGHMVESDLSKTRCPESREAVRKGLSLWSEVKDKLRDNLPLTDADYEKLLLASMYAGEAIAFTGTSLPHGLSYHVTYKMRVPHGKAIGYFEYGFLKEAPEEESANLLGLAGFKTAEELKEFFDTICGGEKLPKDVLEEAVEELMQSEKKLKGAIFPVDRALLERICSTVSLE